MEDTVVWDVKITLGALSKLSYSGLNSKNANITWSDEQDISKQGATEFHLVGS